MLLTSQKRTAVFFLLLDAAEEFQDEDVCTTVHCTKETCLQVERKKVVVPKRMKRNF